MRKDAVVQAKRRLSSASKAVDRLINATELEAFEEAWTDFLAASHAVYLKLELGAEGHPKSEPWFGKKRRERKKDPLLRYIHAARNVDEHGLDLGTAYQTTIEFTSGPPEVVDNEDGTRTAHFQINPADITAKFITPTLVRIFDNKHKDWYETPETHLGEPIDSLHPQHIAAVALVYLIHMVGEAELRIA